MNEWKWTFSRHTHTQRSRRCEDGNLSIEKDNVAFIILRQSDENRLQINYALGFFSLRLNVMDRETDW